ncbi:MAG: sulfatase-like hydrolase/transferase, partial [Bacteroidales bacterium]|nr:sulfatase-like hydrolase/transferase [Bacteroidales bacterium]
MRKVIWLAGIICCMVFYSCSPKQEKPNIILLLTDDQRFDAVGYAGNEQIKTPNIDKLANEGVIFENAYVTTSICCASRASILSGQYALRHGIHGFHTDFSDTAMAQTYPLQLKEKAGYQIGFIGKYGIGLKGHPADKFDYWGCEKVHQPHYENFDSTGKMHHYTDIVNGRIINFLDEYANKGPFCLSVSFKAPHVEDKDPRQFIYHERYKELYSD